MSNTGRRGEDGEGSDFAAKNRDTLLMAAQFLKEKNLLQVAEYVSSSEDDLSNLSELDTEEYYSGLDDIEDPDTVDITDESFSSFDLVQSHSLSDMKSGDTSNNFLGNMTPAKERSTLPDSLKGGEKHKATLPPSPSGSSAPPPIPAREEEEPPPIPRRDAESGLEGEVREAGDAVPASSGAQSSTQDSSDSAGNGSTLDAYNAVALWPFEASDNTELSLAKGDVVIINPNLTDPSCGWLFGTCNGVSGFFPGKYVKSLSENKKAMGENVKMKGVKSLEEAKNIQEKEEVVEDATSSGGFGGFFSFSFLKKDKGSNSTKSASTDSKESPSPALSSISDGSNKNKSCASAESASAAPLQQSPITTTMPASTPPSPRAPSASSFLSSPGAASAAISESTIRSPEKEKEKKKDVLSEIVVPTPMHPMERLRQEKLRAQLGESSVAVHMTSPASTLPTPPSKPPPQTSTVGAASNSKLPGKDGSPAALTCQACRSLLDNPRTLMCMHSFCFACLRKLAISEKSSASSFECPTCRMDNCIPLNMLPKNLDLQNAIKTFKDSKPPPASSARATSRSSGGSRGVGVVNGSGCGGRGRGGRPVPPPKRGQSGPVHTAASSSGQEKGGGGGGNMGIAHPQARPTPPPSTLKPGPSLHQRESSSKTSAILQQQRQQSQPARALERAAGASEGIETHNGEKGKSYNSSTNNEKMFASLDSAEGVHEAPVESPEEKQRLQQLRVEKLKAEGVVAHFQFNEEKAKESVMKWLSNLWFAPANFQLLTHMSEVRPIFFPFWFVSVSVHTQYFGKELQSMEVTRDDGNKVVQSVWVAGKGSREDRYSDIILFAAQDKNLQEWNAKFPKKDWVPLAASHPPSPKYELLTPVEWVDVWINYAEELKKEEKKKSKSDWEKRQGLKVKDVVVTCDFHHMQRRLIYLPVYRISYMYKGDPFTAMVNGQSGRVVGERAYGLGTGAKLFQQFTANAEVGLSNLKEKYM